MNWSQGRRIGSLVLVTVVAWLAATRGPDARGGDLPHSNVLGYMGVGGMALLGLRAWWRSGFWLPNYLHVLAGLAFGFGVFCCIVAPPAAPGAAPPWGLPGVLAFGVYAVFILCGGANASVRRIGKDILYHVSMDATDVREIFEAHVDRCLLLDVRDILAIGVDGKPLQIARPGGRFYKLYIRAKEVENRQYGVCIVAGFWLEDHTRGRGYVPHAFTEIVFARNGSLIKDPLAGLK